MSNQPHHASKRHPTAAPRHPALAPPPPDSRAGNYPSYQRSTRMTTTEQATTTEATMGARTGSACAVSRAQLGGETCWSGVDPGHRARTSSWRSSGQKRGAASPRLTQDVGGCCRLPTARFSRRRAAGQHNKPSWLSSAARVRAPRCASAEYTRRPRSAPAHPGDPPHPPIRTHTRPPTVGMPSGVGGARKAARARCDEVIELVGAGRLSARRSATLRRRTTSAC